MFDMFTMFDNQKNPFMSILGMMGTDNRNDMGAPDAQTDGKEAPAGAQSGQLQLSRQFCMAQMKLMEGALMTQMQLMQALWMLPLQVTQGLVDLAEKTASTGQTGGFRLGNLEVPPELLSRLMQMDMSPENLEKLQGVLDFLFAASSQPDEQ